MRHVFESMGTVVSVEAPADAPIAQMKAAFVAADERFSLYRDDSELSKIAAGQVQLTAASDELRSTYERALEWRARTDGLFTPNRPDGITDLNGIVKADAIAAAGAILEAAGFRDWTINAGGDILVSGTQADGTAWSIGIVDPANRGALLCSIPVTSPRRAVATSGSVERGDHIWLGGSVERAELIQVTVLADDIVTADVLATAIIAGGPNSIDALVARFGVDVLTVDRQGAMLATPGIRALITA